MSRFATYLTSRDPRLTLLLLVVGAVGGVLASFTPVPMPFLMGSLTASALWAALRKQDFHASYVFPTRVRMIFIAIIGTLIGARVDPAFVAQIGQMWISLLAVTVFVVVAHVFNYQLFRRVGGFDGPTSYFAGTPGGLLESVELGQAAGADARILTLQHYLRVILVIMLLPAGLSIFHGEALGSAGGMQLSDDAGTDLSGLPGLLGVAAGGLVAARILRLPAGPLLGSLLVSGVGSGLGLWQLHSPPWVVMVAQTVIGVSLGARFIGVTLAMVRKSAAFAVLSVLGMLAISALIAAITAPLMGEGFEVLLISLAPGGAIEMGLVALSLSVNPAFVAFHHLYRIGLAIVDLLVVGRWLGFLQTADK